jgi:hypothetical protein
MAEGNPLESKVDGMEMTRMELSKEAERRRSAEGEKRTVIAGKSCASRIRRRGCAGWGRGGKQSRSVWMEMKGVAEGRKRKEEKEWGRTAKDVESMTPTDLSEQPYAKKVPVSLQMRRKEWSISMEDFFKMPKEERNQDLT